MNEPPDPRSSIWAWIAYSLRFHRMDRGLTGDAAAKLINCSRSTISRLESGDAKLNDNQAATLDSAWRLGHFFAVALWFARLGYDPNWQKNYVQFESRASIVQMFSNQLVPVLFQTPEYARALLVAGRNADVDGDLARRMARQEPLTRVPPPELWLLLSESVLEWPVGNVQILKQQLAHLHDLSHLPHVTIRVVPKSAGAYEGLDGSFKVITVKEGEVGFIEAPTGGRLVMDADEARDLRLRFERIGAVALPVDSSRDLIRRAMEA